MKSTSEHKGRIVIVVGPTASGKSALALDLAEQLGGEIVNADSVQVYRRFRIGTAKPSESELARVPHHLIDIVEPWEHFDGAKFVELADATIRDILQRNKVPIVVGGTGMYIEFLLFGLSPSPPQDPNIRTRLKQIAAKGETQRLYEELKEVDPEYAAKISPNDAHRIVRALEVFYVSGQPLSAQHERHEKKLRYDFVALMPNVDRKELYERIDRRFDDMMNNGLLDEVRELMKDERIANSRPMESIGYSQIAAYLKGDYDLDETIRLAKRDTRRYAKRQLTWFRNRLTDIIKVDYPPLREQTVRTIRQFLFGG